MLKRVLKDVLSDSESDGDFTVQQKQKLTRRFIPGAARFLPGAARTTKNPSDDESEEEEESSDEGSSMLLENPSLLREENPSPPSCSEDSGDDSDADSDDDELWPAPCPVDKTPGPKEKGAPERKRGFFCPLCPEKKLCSQQDYDSHVLTKKHLRVAAELAKAEEMGVEAYGKELVAKAVAREKAEAEGVTAVEKRRWKKEKYSIHLRKKREREEGGSKAGAEVEGAVPEPVRKHQKKKLGKREREALKAAEGKELTNSTEEKEVAGGEEVAVKKTAKKTAKNAGRKSTTIGEEVSTKKVVKKKVKAKVGFFFHRLVRRSRYVLCDKTCTLYSKTCVRDLFQHFPPPDWDCGCKHECDNLQRTYRSYQARQIAQHQTQEDENQERRGDQAQEDESQEDCKKGRRLLTSSRFCYPASITSRQ